VRPLPLLLLALAAGCAPRLSGEAGPHREAVHVGAARVVLVSWPEDARAARQVARAVASALPRTARWGGLDAPVTITIHPTHAGLEAAARRPGYDWLRAWARHGTIDLQSPSTWGLFGAGDGEAGRGAARGRAVGGQRSEGDPLADPEPLYLERQEVVYGASHHAFTFLVDRYGEARVRETLRRMQGGAVISRAFQESFGLGEAEFAADFRHYVLWQGWRAGE